MCEPRSSEGASQPSPSEQTGKKQSNISGSWREKFISWLLDKDEGQGMSFLAKAISSGSTFFRAIVILLAAFFLLRHLTLEIIDRFVVQVDEITFSAEGNPVIKIKGEKQELRVVSIPAYQRWISSGVSLDQNTKIEIRATGSVATGLAVPRYLEKVLYNQFKDEPTSQFQEAYGELGWRLSKLEFNQDVYLGWREADGKLVQEYGPDPADTVYGSECVAKKSKEKLIAPNLDYTVIRDKKDLTIFTECEKQEAQSVPEHLKKYHRNREERYQQMYDRISHPETLWFMDNKGDFTVTIITTK